MLYYDKKYKRKKPDEIVVGSQSVTIQLPIYNEMNVVKRLINAVCELDYPKNLLEIQVLDDSTDETSLIISEIVKKKKKAGFNIHHIKRSNRAGFKAGALKNGLETATGEFIAIFDADFIPRKDFLKRTLKYFSSDKIGVVQTRWEHLNERESLLTMTEAFALNAHFVVEQEVRNKAGFFMNFNGTGGVWRKVCILDSGNWENDTLTEDLDLSFRAQLKGWEFIYLRDYTTPAELPSDIVALKTQQFRWTKGAIETAKKLMKKIWNSKIPFRQKIQATIHLTNNVVFPFVLITGMLNIPFLFILNGGKYWVIINFMSVFFLAFISTFVLYFLAQKEIHEDWFKRILIFPLFIGGSMGMSVNNARAVIEGAFNKRSDFVRTPKFSSIDKIDFQKKYKIKDKNYIQLLFEIALAIYSFAGVILSLYLFEPAALPFSLLYFIGFAMVAGLSFKEVFLKK